MDTPQSLSRLELPSHREVAAKYSFARSSLLNLPLHSSQLDLALNQVKRGIFIRVPFRLKPTLPPYRLPHEILLPPLPHPAILLPHPPDILPPNPHLGIPIRRRPIPHRPRLERLGVAHDKERVPRPRERDVQPPAIRQEPNLAVVVRPDGREDDDLLLPPLEPVDRVDLDLRDLRRARVAEEGVQAHFGGGAGVARVLRLELELGPQEVGLPRVGRDDADVGRGEGGVAGEEVADDGDDKVDLGAVDRAATVGFLAGGVGEEDGRLAGVEEGGEGWVGSGLDGFGVLERGLVERLVGEGGDGGPHAVLGVEEDGLDGWESDVEESGQVTRAERRAYIFAGSAARTSSREGALASPGDSANQTEVRRRKCGHKAKHTDQHNRRKLVMVPNERRLLAALHERDERHGLRAHGRLVDEHDREVDDLERR